MEPLFALVGSTVKAAGSMVRDLFVLFAKPVDKTADGKKRGTAGAPS